MSLDTIDAYPLTWPAGRKRTERYRRESSNFETTFARARDDVVREVERLTGRRHGYGGKDAAILSTNIALRRDGLPLAGQRQPDDTGVAVYFTYRDKPMSFACDRWNKVEDNLRAIAKTIEALRGIARWGTGDMLQAAFTGFAALPAPGGSTDWRAVLGFSPGALPLGPDGLKLAYRQAASAAHPDRGGTSDRMAAVNNAYEQAQRELGYA